MRSSLFLCIALSGCVGSATLYGAPDEAPVTPPVPALPDAGLGTPPEPEHDAGATEPNPVDAGQPEPVEPDAGPPPAIDDAHFEGDSFPPQLQANATRSIVVTMRNTGTSTWTKAAGYALAAGGDADPFTAMIRVPLGDADVVAPGDTHDFTFAIMAPGNAGTERTDWQMVREGGARFGDIDARDVMVVGITPPPPFDLNSVVIMGSPDVRGWPVTSQVTNITFSPGNFHIDHSKRGQWTPVVIDPDDGTTQEATVWVFFAINGTWYGTGGERLRPNQADKQLTNASDVGPGWLYDPNRWGVMTNYVPQPGELVGFMVVAGSTRSDNHVVEMERTGVVLIPFPADGITASYPPFAWQE